MFLQFVELYKLTHLQSITNTTLNLISVNFRKGKGEFGAIGLIRRSSTINLGPNGLPEQESSSNKNALELPQTLMEHHLKLEEDDTSNGLSSSKFKGKVWILKGLLRKSF